MDVPLDIARKTIKERIMKTVKMIGEREGNNHPEFYYLKSACLRQDGLYRAWEALFDKAVMELTNENKINETLVKTNLDEIAPIRTYKLADNPCYLNLDRTRSQPLTTI